MRITICAVARAKSDPTAEICRSYQKRLPWDVDIREVEVRRKLMDDKLAEAEADLLRSAIPPRSTIIAMDGRGKTLSSEDFAKRLGRWRDDGIADLADVLSSAGQHDPSSAHSGTAPTGRVLTALCHQERALA